MSLTEFAAFAGLTLDLENQTQVDRLNRVLARSEALVAAALGATQLGERQVEETLYKAVPSHRIHFTHGPVTEINSITISDEVYTVVLDTWGWHAFTPTSVFPVRTAIQCDYLAGYRIDSAGLTNIPEGVRQAILVGALDLQKHPDTRLTGERIGDYQYTLAGGAPGEVKKALPEDALLLLRDYRKPRLS